nr:hypothetical protein [Photobacterium chitinilyticum]
MRGCFVCPLGQLAHFIGNYGKAFDKLTGSDSNIVKELDKRAGDIPNGQNLKETLLEKAGQWKADAQIQRLAIDADFLSKAIKDALSNSY